MVCAAVLFYSEVQIIIEQSVFKIPRSACFQALLGILMNKDRSNFLWYSSVKITVYIELDADSGCYIHRYLCNAALILQRTLNMCSIK